MYGLLQLTLLIETGVVVVPGTIAMFWPLTKKPNTSLKLLLTHSLYSSDAKTNWNVRICVVGHEKSNSSVQRSNTVYPGISAARSGSLPVALIVDVSSRVFGPTIEFMLPELSTMPDSKPMMPGAALERAGREIAAR